MNALLIGFGNVGRKLCKILADRSPYPGLANLEVSVVAITTRSLGALRNPSGIDLFGAVAAFEQRGGFTPDHRDFAQLDTLTAIRTVDCDVVVELSPLNVATKGEPARSHVREALRCGRHVVTANKGPLAWSYGELTSVARAEGRELLYEATVMDGAPVFNLARHCLRGNTILRIDGVLNSTTNVVICEMERGAGLEEAVKRARKLGVVEADPTHDLEGWDAAVKIAVLANALMGGTLLPEDVERESVTTAMRERIAWARAGGRRVKMVCELWRENAVLRGRVAARELSPEEPFAGVEGTTSAVRFSTDVLGTLVITEEAPDLASTAYGVLSDLFALVERRGRERHLRGTAV
jgi:homoserine dehydrogenase